MANFFDLKARRAAQTNGTTSTSTEKQTAEHSRAQPWVEK